MIKELITINRSCCGRINYMLLLSVEWENINLNDTIRVYIEFYLYFF